MALSPSLLVQPNDVRAAAVAVVDAAGVQIGGFDASRPANAALTTVPASAVSVIILPANAARRRFIVHNSSSKTLFLAFAATATTAAYTVAIAGQGTYQGVLNDYTGDVSGVWQAVNGNAFVTEITT